MTKWATSRCTAMMVAILLSGCTDPTAERSEASEEPKRGAGHPDVDVPATGSPPPANAIRLQSIDLLACHAGDVFESHVTEQTSPARWTPKHWDDSSPLVHVVGLEMLYCEKAEFAGHSARDVLFIQDLHTNLTVPEACQAHFDPGVAAAPYTATNNRTLAELLTDVGVEVALVSGNAEVSTLQGLHQLSFEWSDDKGQNHVLFTAADEETEGVLPTAGQIVVKTLGDMFVSLTSTGPISDHSTATRVAEVELTANHMLSDSTLAPLGANKGIWNDPGDFTIEVTSWSDTLCRP